MFFWRLAPTRPYQDLRESESSDMPNPFPRPWGEQSWPYSQSVSKGSETCRMRLDPYSVIRYNSMGSVSDHLQSARMHKNAMTASLKYDEFHIKVLLVEPTWESVGREVVVSHIGAVHHKLIPVPKPFSGFGIYWSLESVESEIWKISMYLIFQSYRDSRLFASLVLVVRILLLIFLVMTPPYSTLVTFEQAWKVTVRRFVGSQSQHGWLPMPSASDLQKTGPEFKVRPRFPKVISVMCVWVHNIHEYILQSVQNLEGVLCPNLSQYDICLLSGLHLFDHEDLQEDNLRRFFQSNCPVSHG